jgi:hypothetical protein
MAEWGLKSVYGSDGRWMQSNSLSAIMIMVCFVLSIVGGASEGDSGRWAVQAVRQTVEKSRSLEEMGPSHLF